MRMPRISISIHLDPSYPIDEVRKFVLDECFEGTFTPLYYIHHNIKGPDIELLDFDNRLKISVLKKGIALPEEIKFGDPYKKDSLAGTFLIKNFSGDIKYPTVHFIQPELKEKQGKTVLDWSTFDLSLQVTVHYSEWKESKTYYVNLDISQGLWGMRHKWLEAMHTVLKEQSEAEILAKKWKNDMEIIHHLKDQAEFFSGIELKEFNFKKIRENLWNTAKKIQEKFTSSEYCAITTPDLERKPHRPFDMPVYHLGKLPENPIMFPDEAWIAICWYECFGWHAPEVINERTITYWANHPSEELFLKTIRYPKLGWKGTWPAIIETITKRPETPEMIHQLLGWIADPNWPGAGQAWEHIYKMGIRALPSIKESILRAKDCGDDWWEEILEDLKENIIENDSKASEDNI